MTSMAPTSEFVHAAGCASVIRIDGPLRAPVGDGLRGEVATLLELGRRSIVLDLSRVPDLDAAGLGELVQAYNMTAAANGVLRVAHIRPGVREMIAHVGLLDLLGGGAGRVCRDAAPVEGAAAGAQVR